MDNYSKTNEVFQNMNDFQISEFIKARPNERLIILQEEYQVNQGHFCLDVVNNLLLGLCYRYAEANDL